MAMTFDEARHLLARTGFGGTPDEIQDWSRLGREAAVDRTLSTGTGRAVTPPPAWVTKLPPPPDERKHRSPEAKKAFQMERREEGLELKGWWYRELATTPSPLTERMTLFWHNHFTSSLQKVKWPSFLYRQNVTLRTHALGSFRDLLGAVAKDPAMIRYLDTQSNHKGRPNENFARELFELFTLGEGHYTEQDIKEAARSFTGWQVDPERGTFRLNQRHHDTGIKSVFGRTGHLSGDDVLNLTLTKPQVAVYLVQKLWREFISDQPNADMVSALATRFHEGRYQIKPLLHSLLTSPAFWALENRGVLIKSPVELLVGTMRLFRLPAQAPLIQVRAGRRLGQDLFDPPNVKGWPGGTRWITTATLLDRWQILQRGIRGHEMGGMHQMGAEGGGSPGSSMESGPHGAMWLKDEPDEVLQKTLLPIEPVYPLTAGEERWQVVRHLVMDPAYQLK